MHTLKSNKLTDLPLEELADIREVIGVDDFCDELTLRNHESWLLPQIFHHYGKWELKYLPSGLIDGRATSEHNMATKFDLGLWKLVTLANRGKLLPKQTAPVSAKYNLLTPIIWGGIKEYQGIPYSKWDLESSSKLLCSKLLEAISLDKIELSLSDVAQTKNILFLIKSGKDAGTLRNPATSYSINSTASTLLADMPLLYCHMLLQTWAAHPYNRNKYNICDPSNWDEHPQAYVSAEILNVAEVTKAAKAARTSKPVFTGVPWE